MAQGKLRLLSAAGTSGFGKECLLHLNKYVILRRLGISPQHFSVNNSTFFR